MKRSSRTFPLLRNADRSKIGKRKNPAARLNWFKEQGFLPQALVNFLALMGYSLPSLEEVFAFDDLAATFDFSRFNVVGPVFGVDKLDWLNGQYLQALSNEEFLRAAKPFLPSGATSDELRPVATALRERTKRLSELPDQLNWLHDGPVAVDLELLTKRGLPAPEAATVLRTLADAMVELSPFEPGPVEEVLDRICAESGTNRRRMFMTTRMAVVGGPVSPPLHETIAALGRDRTVGRVRAASDLILG